MHFSDDVAECADPGIHMIQALFQGIVAFSTQFHVCFQAFLFDVSGLGHAVSPSCIYGHSGKPDILTVTLCTQAGVCDSFSDIVGQHGHTRSIGS